MIKWRKTFLRIYLNHPKHTNIAGARDSQRSTYISIEWYCRSPISCDHTKEKLDQEKKLENTSIQHHYRLRLCLFVCVARDSHTDYEAITIIYRLSIQHLAIHSRLHILSLSTTVIIYIIALATWLPAMIRSLNGFSASAAIYAMVEMLTEICRQSLVDEWHKRERKKTNQPFIGAESARTHTNTTEDILSKEFC